MFILPNKLKVFTLCHQFMLLQLKQYNVLLKYQFTVFWLLGRQIFLSEPICIDNYAKGRMPYCYFKFICYFVFFLINRPYNRKQRDNVHNPSRFNFDRRKAKSILDHTNFYWCYSWRKVLLFWGFVQQSYQWSKQPNFYQIQHSWPTRFWTK